MDEQRHRLLLATRHERHPASQHYVRDRPYIPYPAATMFAWTALAVASDAAPEVKTPS
jgi:hypothetical protein